MPPTVVSWISQQLNVDPASYQHYRWKSRLWDIHLAAIRDYTGFRPGNKEDFQTLGQWLIEEVKCHPTRWKMYAAAIQRCRSLRIELPSEKELQRLVSSAWNQYLSQACQAIANRIEPLVREKMELTDNITDIFLTLIRRIQKKADGGNQTNLGCFVVGDWVVVLLGVRDREMVAGLGFSHLGF